MVSRNPNKIGNKIKRKEQHVKVKRAKENEKRDDRLRRRRTEDKNPALREARRAKNIPQTIDRKRTWDTAGAGEEDDRLGLSVDLNAIKRRKVEDGEEEEDGAEEEEEEKDSDVDSMVDFDEEDEELDEDAKAAKQLKKDEEAAAKKTRAPSPTLSTAATNLSLTPEGLASKFPSLFENTGRDPKVLVTTSINSFLHEEAALLTSLFPNSVYIKRTAHFHAHKYSVSEISSFASNRNYTHVVILNEDQKKPKGLDIVHLPHGPMFHFSINNWVEGAKLPGHGNPTSHDPELILNNFRTPLGLLTAHLFRQIFPPQPQIQGRQVVTLHNQRDYIFVRRHRYVFRDKRATEKSIVGPDGKLVEGVEDIRAGLQELGPRFTLKLRRIDKGIQRRSGQEWEWKAGDEKVRTRFAL
ncbi:hypothetical protein AUEXF2481DRAFT_40775 [Aureobasidium subglaciale EXF-2481]|uniref:Brix domain-containing protein n=1 Tax=Aureobasidium subglaciale (strain EXF-2481) TaxID=1043005 RepID=A0A074YFI4_AURSE|nr:uncharacterized protein AUEXF2481DRAFT_40775 [Aureobasidium subglaciale EXF-2481]KAI5212320.1 Brix-domain-containing protein [Aureobasidium subglaciale]KAI5231545.1 Brix-domain-containing protein [Aureobasidium subglaciale]KAI5234418.1 Brix-domain-containing protein [Aureobasidium subglaciale]KAI5268073.1 Brix-domain-containing protein [Aureobasidium subglaciale]KEQ94819.1 hypothetical protein AUEXF2481DRAFT_40775 [Aureobasidium subglaciale EXF-2481]